MARACSSGPLSARYAAATRGLALARLRETLSGSREPSPFSEGGHIARAVNNADNDDHLGSHQIVDRVGAMERHTEAGRKLVTSRTGKRKVPQRLEGRLDRADKTRGDSFRRFSYEPDPDFGKVGLSRIGQPD